MRREINKGVKATAEFKKIQARIVGKQIFDQMRAEIAEIESKFVNAKNLQGQLLVKEILLELVNNVGVQLLVAHIELLFEIDLLQFNPFHLVSAKFKQQHKNDQHEDQTDNDN